MRLYLAIIVVAWTAIFASFLYAYQFLLRSPDLQHDDLIGMMVTATTLVVSYGLGVSELLKEFDRLPRWGRAGAAVLATGIPSVVLALALGTHQFSSYNWPGLSGVAIALFQQYRMFIFIGIPLPIACCMCALLAFCRPRPQTRIGSASIGHFI